MILAVHERIVREALGAPGLLAPGALRSIIAANKWSDLYQFSAERHFDNGADRAALCALWRHGVRANFDRALACSAPQADDARLVDREGALRALGLATHALADFYSHTNWVELAGARGEEPLSAPLVSADCVPADLPTDLESGYFSLRHGLSGCPRRNGRFCPPAPYHFCHAQLNKDAPDRGHGAERTVPGGATYHEVAVRLAVATTRAAWDAVGSQLRAAYGDERGERIWRTLAHG